MAGDNCDWSQLVQVARITDMLVLGIISVLAEFEPQCQHAHAGRGAPQVARNELRVPLSLGLVFVEHNRVALDLDAEIVAAIAWVFAAFRDKGSARQVGHLFLDEGLQLQSHATSEPTHDLVRWRAPDPSRITDILRNPNYAGTFVYRGTETHRQPDGSVHHRTVPPSTPGRAASCARRHPDREAHGGNVQATGRRHGSAAGKGQVMTGGIQSRESACHCFAGCRAACNSQEFGSAAS